LPVPWPIWPAVVVIAPGFADIAIAATARRHDLTILSHNARHFEPMDATVVDPFQKLPSDK
jgi:predicted nucleic acid-binding protein